MPDDPLPLEYNTPPPPRRREIPLSLIMAGVVLAMLGLAAVVFWVWLRAMSVEEAKGLFQKSRSMILQHIRAIWR